MKIKKKGNYLEIEGKLYKVNQSRSSTTEKFEDMEFEPVNSNIQEMIKKIADKVKDAVNPEEIVENALYDLDEETIKKLFKKLTLKKTKPKMRKRYGCFHLNVGGIDIPIRD